MNAEQTLDNRRMLTRLSIVAVAMFGFGFALAPFYEHICRALGVDSLVENGDNVFQWDAVRCGHRYVRQLL